jgi:hypothetical protein
MLLELMVANCQPEQLDPETLNPLFELTYALV